MNKKMVVIVMFGTIQSAYASLFETLLRLPGVRKICAIVVAQNNNRKSIMPAETSEFSKQEKKLIKKEFALQKQNATNAYGLKISANIAGNITLETHDESTIAVHATAKGFLEEELGNVTYKLERNPDKTNVFLLNSYDNNQSKSRPMLDYLFFWRKQPQKSSLNSLDFSIKIPKYFNQLTIDSIVEGDFTLLSHGLTEAACICALKGKGGKILVNNFTGTLDAETTNGSIVTNNHTGLLALKTNKGNVTANKWSINNPRSIVNSIRTDDGNIKVELPNDITVTTEKSTNVLYEKQRYTSSFIMPFKKGSGLHQVTISTPGKIELD